MWRHLFEELITLLLLLLLLLPLLLLLLLPSPVRCHLCCSVWWGCFSCHHQRLLRRWVGK
jgi:hypothetical protein